VNVARDVRLKIDDTRQPRPLFLQRLELTQLHLIAVCMKLNSPYLEAFSRMIENPLQVDSSSPRDQLGRPQVDKLIAHFNRRLQAIERLIVKYSVHHGELRGALRVRHRAGNVNIGRSASRSP